MSASLCFVSIVQSSPQYPAKPADNSSVNCKLLAQLVVSGWRDIPMMPTSSAYEILVNVAISSSLPKFGQPKWVKHCQVPHIKSHCLQPTSLSRKIWPALISNLPCGKMLRLFFTWCNWGWLVQRWRLVSSSHLFLLWLNCWSPWSALAAVSSHVGHIDVAARAVAWHAPSVCSCRRENNCHNVYIFQVPLWGDDDDD